MLMQLPPARVPPTSKCRSLFPAPGTLNHYFKEENMEPNTTTIEEHAGAKMCRAGAATERPCWRPATERDIGETAPTLCALHMELRRRAENLDAHLHALEGMRGFLKSEAVDEDPHGALRDLAIGWYDTVTEEAADAAHKLRVAEFLAAQGPDNQGPKDSIMREYGAHLHVRSDALADAFATLIDERELSETERLVTIAAVKDATKRVNEEYEKFRDEQGLRE
jgi:hypothetical protein